MLIIQSKKLGSSIASNFRDSTSLHIINYNKKKKQVRALVRIAEVVPTGRLFTGSARSCILGILPGIFLNGFFLIIGALNCKCSPLSLSAQSISECEQAKRTESWLH